MSLEWEEPAPSGKRRGYWPQVVAELQTHPGRWALVLTADRSKSSVRQHLRSFGCEVTERQQADGSIKFYARWPKGKEAAS